MTEELLVFGGDHGLDQAAGDLLERDPHLDGAEIQPPGPRLGLALAHEAGRPGVLPGEGAHPGAWGEAGEEVDEVGDESRGREEEGGEQAMPHDRSAG